MAYMICKESLMLSPYCEYIIPVQASGLIVGVWAIEDNIEITGDKRLDCEFIKRTKRISVVVPIKRRRRNFAELNSATVNRRKYISVALVNQLHKIANTFLVLEATQAYKN